jgi:hypothetical protein
MHGSAEDMPEDKIEEELLLESEYPIVSDWDRVYVSEDVLDSYVWAYNN